MLAVREVYKVPEVDFSGEHLSSGVKIAVGAGDLYNFFVKLFDSASSLQNRRAFRLLRAGIQKGDCESNKADHLEEIFVHFGVVVIG